MRSRRLEALAHVAILLAALLACKSGSKGDDSRASPGAARDPAPAAESVATIKAADILADYKGNEVRGDAKWKGKLVKVVGIVGDIKKDIMDTPYVTVGTGADFEIPMVQCSLKGGQEGAAANLSKGQAVALKGRVSGLMMNVQLDDCEVLIQGKTADQMRGNSPPAAAQPQPAPAKPMAPPRKR
jgi:hypothetical protein